MWNIYFDDLLHLIPEAVAYADDLTIHISYAKEHTQENSERLQWIIDLTTKWGKVVESSVRCCQEPVTNHLKTK